MMNDTEKRIRDASMVPSAEVVIFDSIDSTNNEARRRAERGDTVPSLIIAEHQTAGRGRLGRSFYSPANTGLYMTALFEISSSPSDTVFLTTAAAVAMAKAIEKCAGISVDIKWVNDLYLFGKKICGILCESFATGNRRYVAVGIGVNLYTEDFPEELSEIAASLCPERDVKYELASEVFGTLWRFYDTGDRTDMLEYYRAHSMVLDKRVVFYENEKAHFGVAESIDKDGRLCVALDDGSKKILSSGEITLRLDKGDRNE